MNIQATLKECETLVNEKRYSRHPFITGLRTNPPSMQSLCAWAIQKYHQVYQQNRIFSAIHTQSPHEDVRQFMMEQLIAEETEISCGTDSHYNLMRRFAEACGAHVDCFRADKISPQVSQYTNRLVSICQEQHFTIGMLTIYAIESQSSESVANFLNWLREVYSFSDDHLEWFTVHSEEDDEHADKGLELVIKYADSVPNFEKIAPKCVSDICDSWLALHDYYLSLLQGKDAMLSKTKAGVIYKCHQGVYLSMSLT